MNKMAKATKEKTAVGYSFNDKTLKVLANFASINPSLIVYGDKLAVINNSKSVIGEYKFDEPFDFESFGLYECGEFLQAYQAFDKPSFTVDDKYVLISGAVDKLKYYTTAQELIPKVPNVSDKFEKVDCDLVFSLSADKLALLNKMAGIIKSKFIFFETDGDAIRLTVGDELESSANTYNIAISDGIQTNKLDQPVKIALSDFKILPGDYEIKISSKISKFSSTFGVEYYIGTSV